MLPALPLDCAARPPALPWPHFRPKAVGDGADMPLTLLLALQAAAPPPVPVTTGPGGLIQLDFDLGKYSRSASCDGGGPYDVVVCGSRRNAGRNRVYPLTGDFEAKPLVAEMGVGGNMKASMELEDVELTTGIISHRMMMRLKLPF
jgi:hypothetical protein